MSIPEAKVAGTGRQVVTADHLGIEWPAYRLLGVAELLGALGLVIGLWLSWLGVVAALCLVALMAGALYLHRRAGDDIRRTGPAIGYTVLALGTLILRVLTA